MAKRKRKTLPEVFQDLLREGNFDALKAIFDTCQIDAYERYSKMPALAFGGCSDELTYWLVKQGADVMALDTYAQTPLHCRASDPDANIAILLELGADVNVQSPSRGTALHCTASQLNLHHAKTLIGHGADVNATNRDGVTTLDWALQICSNSDLPQIVLYAEYFLEEGAIKTPQMKNSVSRIGTSFEFHRGNFSPDSLKATNGALFRLYDIFGVEPIPRRKMHDGLSPIIAGAGSVNDRHYELWQLLVPTSGAADTVQGEIVRISGKIYRELNHDGGVNWGRSYRELAKEFLVLIRSGEPLSPDACAEAEAVIGEIETGYGDALELLGMAVDWVALNPTPIKLPAPDYAL